MVRYGTHDVFFLDEESYPEAPGFWVRPGRSRVVVGETAGPLGLFVRNAPVANRSSSRAGAWQRTLDLAPGQEMRVEVPPTGRATPIEIRAAHGVRPFDGDRRNRDFRLLGVWIAIEYEKKPRTEQARDQATEGSKQPRDASNQGTERTQRLCSTDWRRARMRWSEISWRRIMLVGREPGIGAKSASLS